MGLKSFWFLRPEEGPAPGVDQSYAFTGHFALNADLRVPDRLTRQIEEILGDACHGHEILYSTRILKKTGLRISA